jgi:AmiR/NasT family two-component response regulator
MSAPARIQNFSGLRALVVSRQTEEQPLEAALQRLGISAAFHGPDDAWPEALSRAHDLLIIESDLHPRGVAGAQEAGIADVPVIGLLGVEAPGRLRALMALGATAFLRKPVYAPAVYPAVYLAVNAHRERQHLRAQLAAHDRRRGGRRFLIKAIIALMRRDECGEDLAYEILRRAAMRERLSIEAYCELWLEREAASLGRLPGRAQL